ncbi:hypothetical protein HYZ97_01955 [Candidatus Pacearchaeota archaeon]|nr:hypothetical protein [Candidatus Pacearchaeota archaeon]
MSFAQFLSALKGDKVEGEIVKTIFSSLITSFLLFFFLFYLKLKSLDGFSQNYVFFLFFLIVSYALLLPAVRQVQAFKELPCMSGMMIGMTLGMISGFLPGFFVSSTNGMFVGGIFGMAVGIGFGIYNGKCCGIMGILEGTMAGFMGGLMGAMTSLMMFNDHLKSAGVIVFLISGFILFGLNYMIYNESRNLEVKIKEGQFITIVLSFILTALSIWLMVFGPRSLLFQ